MSKPLPFSHSDYDKLQHPVFPTIRRRDKYGDVGNVRDVTVGPRGDRETWGKAEVIAKETVTIKKLNDQFFCWDTQSREFDGAMETINKFYRNGIQRDEELTLYWNKWVDTNEQVDL